jgi:hypothetical protein
MRRRGAALAGAILALVVLTALVTTAFITGFLERRAGRSSLHAVHALEAAEAGLAMVLGEWQGLPQAGTLAVGDSVLLPSVPLGRWTSFTPTVWRRTEHLFLIRSEGVRVDADGGILARRALALLGRQDSSTLRPLPQRSWMHLY